MVSLRESTAALSARRGPLDAVSGGATMGRGSHTLGFGGAGSVTGDEGSAASATLRGESPHPMAAPKMTTRTPKAGGDSMRPAW
jgi:hypothetical protein